MIGDTADTDMHYAYIHELTGRDTKVLTHINTIWEYIHTKNDRICTDIYTYAINTHNTQYTDTNTDTHTQTASRYKRSCMQVYTVHVYISQTQTHTYTHVFNTQAEITHAKQQDTNTKAPYTQADYPTKDSINSVARMERVARFSRRISLQNFLPEKVLFLISFSRWAAPCRL